MKHRFSRLGVVVGMVAAATVVSAQRGGGRGGGAPQSPQQSAPIDLTGYWVSIVNEDWRWRMVTPPKGDAGAPAGDGRGGPGRGGPPARSGDLKVTTTNLSGGWLRRNGVPNSTRCSGACPLPVPPYPCRPE